MFLDASRPDPENSQSLCTCNHTQQLWFILFSATCMNPLVVVTRKQRGRGFEGALRQKDTWVLRTSSCPCAHVSCLLSSLQRSGRDQHEDSKCNSQLDLEISQQLQEPGDNRGGCWLVWAAGYWVTWVTWPVCDFWLICRDLVLFGQGPWHKFLWLTW